MEGMNIYQKLGQIQTQVKAPKGNYNSFGKYHYRSAEDILEALKPYLAQYGVVLIMEDEVVVNGTSKIMLEKGSKEVPVNYIKATAHFIDCESGKEITTSAFARECEHKGMSEDQCTGTASSYARKYCLNAMFLLDDTKDSDTDEMKNIENAANQQATQQRQQNGGQSWGNRQQTAPASQGNQNGWGSRQQQGNAQPANGRQWGKQAG